MKINRNFFALNSMRNRALLALFLCGLFLSLTSQISQAYGGGGGCGSAPGRFTGGGLIICPSCNYSSDSTRVTFGFELHCDPTIAPDNLEINFGGNQFHLESVQTSDCFEATGQQGHPDALVDTIVLNGTGRYRTQGGDTTEASIVATLVDAGEPGTNDSATFIITTSDGTTVLNCSATLTGGNIQAHQENKD